METLFSRIAKGEIPSYKIAEDDRYFAFLDINPLVHGHTLVIPKQPIDYIFDLDDPLLEGLICFSKKIAKAIEKAVYNKEFINKARKFASPYGNGTAGKKIVEILSKIKITK